MERYNSATLDFLHALAPGEFKTSEQAEAPSKNFESIYIEGLEKEAELRVSEDINVISLNDLLLQKYKTEWLEWLPEVIDKEFFGETRNEILSNKVQAIRACLTTDTPWLDWNIFEKVGKAFNHQMPEFGRVQPLSLGECAVTLHLMNRLRPEEVSEEVLSYIGSVAGNEDYVYIPEDLEIGKAQPYLDRFVKDFDLQKAISDLWNKVANKNLLQAKYKDDNPLHRQIAKLAILKQFYEENVNV